MRENELWKLQKVVQRHGVLLTNNRMAGAELNRCSRQNVIPASNCITNLSLMKTSKN